MDGTLKIGQHKVGGTQKPLSFTETQYIFKLAVRFRVHAGRAELLRTEITGRPPPPALKLF